MRGSRKHEDLWDPDGDLVEKPRHDIPRVGKVADKARFRSRWVTATIYVTPIALLISGFAIATTIQTPQATTPITSLSIEQAQSQAVAIQAVRAWLASDPQPLPGAQVVAWSGQEASQALPSKDQGLPMSTHHVTVADAQGQLYTASLAITHAPSGPVATSTPALSAYVPSDEQSVASPWRGLVSVQGVDREDIARAVQVWASAYFSYDPGLLQQTVGDTDRSHAYMPMPKATVTTTVLDMSALAPDEGKTDATNPSVIIARVEVIASYGTTDPSKSVKPMTFDVRIHEANTATPRVVAWGGAGSGPSLSAYTNAISGIDITLAPTEDK